MAAIITVVIMALLSGRNDHGIHGMFIFPVKHVYY